MIFGCLIQTLEKFRDFAGGTLSSWSGASLEKAD